MQYLSAVLSTSLLTSALIGGCSSGSAPIAFENPPAAELADTKTETSEMPAPESKDSEVADAENSDPDAADSTDSKDEAPDTEGVDQKNVVLLIDDQETAGQIIVKKVSTSRDGWVSIHQSKKDGTMILPESIGEARVDAGDNEEVVVDLWESPEIGEKLWVLLHIDSGERGLYEFPDKDVPVKKNGEIMARSFSIKGTEKEKDENAE